MYPPCCFYGIAYDASDRVTDEEKKLIQDFGGGWRLPEGESQYVLSDPVRGLVIVLEPDEYLMIKSVGNRRTGRSFRKRYQPKGGWDSIHVFRWLMQEAGLLTPLISGYIPDYEC